VQPGQTALTFTFDGLLTMLHLYSSRRVSLRASCKYDIPASCRLVPETGSALHADKVPEPCFQHQVAGLAVNIQGQPFYHLFVVCSDAKVKHEIGCGGDKGHSCLYFCAVRQHTTIRPFFDSYSQIN